MTTGGAYLRRFYLEPALIKDMLDLPDGMDVHYVAWSNERQCFIIMLDMPEEPGYFVSANEIVPEMPVSIVKVSEGGNERLQVRLPSALKKGPSRAAKPRSSAQDS
jgi:hypothetical protein